MAFAAVYVIWGSTYLAIRFGVATIPPFVMAGTRFAVAGGLLYGWARLRGAPAPVPREWFSAAVVGVLLLFIANGGVTWAEQRVPSGIAALLAATVPLWMVVLDWTLHGGARPRPGTIAGLAAGLIGVVLLVGPAQFFGPEKLDMVGITVLLFASVSWAVGSLYSRKAVLPASPLLATSMEMLSGAAALYTLALLTGEFSTFHPETVTAKSWLAVGYLATFGSIIGFSAYVWLLRVAHASRVSTYAYVNPVIALLLGWALAGEAFTPQMLVAAGVIILGVVLIITSQSRNDSPARPAQVRTFSPITSHTAQEAADDAR
ncbi:MAG TPA: EamA family transporter [Bacteroidota bacterium]|nr:EamA family transporter [Bacteroidota bacterium]